MSLNAPAEIKMINNIAAHFGYLRSEQAAAAAVADHIGRFWDPRMKHRLLLLVDSDITDLDPISVAAAALLR
jgi:formate dehydrogenase subunit delta